METTATTTTTSAPAAGDTTAASAASTPTVNTGITVSNADNAWRAALPDEYKGDPSFKNFQSQEDVLKAYKNAASLVGLDKYSIIRRPKDDAPPEEFDKYYNSLGRPENLDGYKIPDIEADYKPSEDYLKGMKEFAHKQGMTEKQFSELVKYQSELAKQEATQSVNAMNQQAVQTAQKLRQEFGQAYEDKIFYMKRGIEATGGDELLSVLQNTGALAHPSVAKAFIKLGELTKEDVAHSGGSGGGIGGHLTPAEADFQLNEFLGDPKNKAAYLSGDKAAVEKVTRLNQYKYPTQKAN